MTKDVMIHIKGTQYDESGGQAPIEVITRGTYYEKNNKNYVIYEEIVVDTGGSTKNTLKFSDDEVSLKRTGDSNVQMIFSPNSKTVSNYRTPFGNLAIGIDTNEIVFNENDRKMTLDVKYALDVNYEFLANCELSVIIEAVDENFKIC